MSMIVICPSLLVVSDDEEKVLPDVLNDELARSGTPRESTRPTST